MKILSANFVKSATKAVQYPELKVPEFAFYGKSNTGKSTLINMLVNKHGLVKTGSRPGMTKNINFFLVNEQFCFADLPGFGFAQLPEAIRVSFKPMLHEYFSSRKTLKMVFLLLDLRRTPGEEEMDIITELADLAIPTGIIGTKADKLSKNELHKSLQTISQVLDVSPEDIFVTSAKDKVGGQPILALISQIVHQPKRASKIDSLL